MSSIEKLLSISTEPLSRQAVVVNIPEFNRYGSLANELLDLLRRKNGFYAFESALHVCQRLVLKKPLVLGGNYSLENVFAAEAVEGMRLRGHIATQIKDLPDGTQVDFRVTD